MPGVDEIKSKNTSELLEDRKVSLLIKKHAGL